MEQRYVEPGWFTRTVFNRLVALVTKAGFGVFGSRVLRVPGRRSGEPRETPVNLLDIGEQRYLVSPRGETQWVRNLRAAGGGELVLGRAVQAFRAVEIGDDDKPAVLRAYLQRWGFEVGAFFEGVGVTSTDAQLRHAAPGHPVFRIDLADGRPDDAADH